MKKLATLGLLAAAALPTLSALGQTITYDEYLPAVGTPPPNDVEYMNWGTGGAGNTPADFAVSIPKFDTVGGTRQLTGISLTLNTTMYTDQSISVKTGFPPVTGYIVSTPVVTVYSPDGTTLVTSATVTSPTVTVTGGSVNNFPTVVNSKSSTENIASANFSVFIGSGSVSAGSQGAQTWVPYDQFGNPQSNSGDSSYTTGKFDLQIVYTYTTVPEPRVFGAIGAVACFGLLGIQRVRQLRRSAQA